MARDFKTPLTVDGVSVPTISSTDTLSNKTLTTPTIASFTNAVHDHTSAAGGGTISVNSGTTGTLTVNRGGTGTTTLTGILKGNGTTAITAVTAPTGAIVGTTDTQTLSAKTFSDNIQIVGSVSTPTTPSTNTGKISMSGTTAVRPTFINSGGVVETVLTNTTQTSLGYAQVTADINASATTATAATGLSTTVTIPSGGRRIKITAHATNITASGITTPIITVWDGTVGSGTQIGQTRAPSIPASGYYTSAIAMAVATPSAGSKTYNVGFANTAGINVTYAATSTAPMFILVEPI